MKPLIDGDVLRYELGYAAETGVRAITEDPDALPSFRYVEELLLARLAQICDAVKATEEPEIFITEGDTFRYQIAETKPYKGTRKSKKPWHFDNLTAYFKGVMGARVVTYLEADDALAIEHTKDPEGTVIVTRDKDLRQVPGWLYSWELGAQPAFGPALITKKGHLHLNDKKKLTGTGLPFFYSQLLTGDTVDNIPGLPKVGPVAAFQYWLASGEDHQSFFDIVKDLYDEKADEDYLLEQGRLLWMTRRLRENNEPVLWEIGMTE